ncbi:molybdenum cofactor biosynthesis protein MoaF [Microbacterium protaetiae]|uniref:Molybdenum cofactor biosynthesis protein MoaF n=1 Tax=Microbacterium protaetiae TaxID=2509458 RepID=A0A4P6EA14_9MICO|nr:MoaF C-terminal domain-containing protein [Microbacterium protaetiae]QAY58885.1 molybdenum cofactor biosynthesis protein MoaF [Microbacterium protaetiae]
MTDTTTDPALDEWRTYDDFSAGIDTYRLPNTSLAGTALTITLDDGSRIRLAFDEDAVAWSATGAIEVPEGTRDPYDAVAVREDVVFVNLPLESREREALTLVYSTATHRALAVVSHIDDEEVEGTPRVSQRFFAGVTDRGEPTGEAPGPSRDLIGKRNVYRYSPHHLYEHVYISSQRYAWQCLEGVQRGHGDMDLSTVWRFADGLYLFCFREFRIAVASVWLHDLGYQLMTTGVFLGLNGEGRAEHSRGGGHIYPLGSVSYPDAQPI